MISMIPSHLKFYESMKLQGKLQQFAGLKTFSPAVS